MYNSCAGRDGGNGHFGPHDNTRLLLRHVLTGGAGKEDPELKSLNHYGLMLLHMYTNCLLNNVEVHHHRSATV